MLLSAEEGRAAKRPRVDLGPGRQGGLPLSEKGGERPVQQPLESSRGAGLRLCPQTVALRTASNNAGGTLGGISSGADVIFRVAVKPVSTISQPQRTASFNGAEAVLEVQFLALAALTGVVIEN